MKGNLRVFLDHITEENDVIWASRIFFPKSMMYGFHSEAMLSRKLVETSTEGKEHKRTELQALENLEETGSPLPRTNEMESCTFNAISVEETRL